MLVENHDIGLQALEAPVFLGLQNLPHDVLFSRRRFKQCGAVYQLSAVGDQLSAESKAGAADS
jgi:hypothetical protein